MTLSITTFSITTINIKGFFDNPINSECMTLSITTLCTLKRVSHYAECLFTECSVSFMIRLNYIMLNVVMAIFIILSVFWLNFVKLNIYMLSVVYAECQYAKRQFAECQYAECQYAECR